MNIMGKVSRMAGAVALGGVLLVGMGHPVTVQAAGVEHVALIVGGAALAGLNYHASQPVASGVHQPGARIPALPAAYYGGVPQADGPVGESREIAAVYSMAPPVSSYRGPERHDRVRGPAVLYVSATPSYPVGVQQLFVAPVVSAPRTGPVGVHVRAGSSQGAGFGVGAAGQE
jgi:hypothetical protein